MSATNIYTSIGCNVTTDAADWGNNNLIVFAANNVIALYDPEYKNYSAKILCVYAEHKKRVNTVRWLRPISSNVNESYILSGGDDCLGILWHVTTYEQVHNEQAYSVQAYKLSGHRGGVNAVDGVQRSNGHWVLATASTDCSIRLWSYNKGSVHSIESTQILSLNTTFCFTLKMTFLPKTDIVMLAFSTDENSVELWIENHGQFGFIHKLLGHEDWVRGLDFVTVNHVDVLLASCSQDNFIRLWRISPRNESNPLNNKIKLTGEHAMEENVIQPSENLYYTVTSESVLCGHEGWVYGVHWYKSKNDELSLLSASIDKTLIVWQQVKEEGDIWIEKVRLGEMGGNSLGFFGCKFSNNGKSILSHSYQGGLHIWKLMQDTDNHTTWHPQVIVSGHFGEVRDLSWEPHGEYLMSVSSDQTTRLHAPWRKIQSHINLSTKNIEECTWHELARPQVHGYDMQTLAILTRYEFASGAEEKVVRIFKAPCNFIENFRNISGVQDDAENKERQFKDLPKGASVPSLGLSNKAVYTGELQTSSTGDRRLKDEYPEQYFVPIKMETPPKEEALMQNTLWPEVQKLYGHGYEIYALASSPNGRILASACKSNNDKHAQIILWNTSNWKQMQKLYGHQLTVTQMRFSPNGMYLLSVSRDRLWLLFECEVDDENVPMYKLIARTDKTNGIHGRIIWSCDWSHDSNYFVTSSRDGKVVAWTKSVSKLQSPTSLNDWEKSSVLDLRADSITAVAFAPYLRPNNSYIVALGCERGLIFIYQFDGKWENLLILDESKAHHMTVKRLQYRPKKFILEDYYELASCGEDHLVRIYGIQL